MMLPAGAGPLTRSGFARVACQGARDGFNHPPFPFPASIPLARDPAQLAGWKRLATRHHAALAGPGPCAGIASRADAPTGLVEPLWASWITCQLADKEFTSLHAGQQIRVGTGQAAEGAGFGVPVCA